MSTLTLKAPAPNWQFEHRGLQYKADLNGVITGIQPGSEVAKALISCGCAVLFALPATDPHVVGAPWNNNGTLTLSAG